MPLAQLPSHFLQQKRGVLDRLPRGRVELARGDVDVVVLDLASPLLGFLECAARPGADDAVLGKELGRLKAILETSR